MSVTALSLLLVALAAPPVPPPTQEADLSLGGAIRLAESESPDLAAAGASAESARASALALERQLRPQVGLSLDWYRSDDPLRVFAAKLGRGDLAASDFDPRRMTDPDPISHAITALTVQLPVDVSGRIRTGTRAARAAADASDAQKVEAVQDVRLAAAQAWLALWIANRHVGITEHALDVARHREDETSARRDAGTALEADLLRARARRREREADLARSRGEAAVASATLERVLATRTPPAVVAELPTLAWNDHDLAEWQEIASAHRGAVTAANSSLLAATWAEKSERRSRLPSLGLWGELDDQRGGLHDGQSSSSFGASLRWSVFDPTFGARTASRAAATRAAAAGARSTLDQIRLDVESAWQHLGTSRERLAAAEGGAAEGREALRVVSERRAAGMATLTDELETETASLSAELAELAARVEVVAGELRLLRAAGILDPAVVQETK